MADSKITALTALTSADPANDMIPIVDVSDTPPASGNTKRISINNILAASGTATLASATITGAATVGTTLGVTGASTLASVGVTGAATVGTTLGVTGNLTVQTNKLFVNANGVGIGTLSPFVDAGYGAIDIRGTTGGEVVLGSTSVREASITADGTNGLVLNTVTANPLQFWTQGVERARFNTTGNLAFVTGKGIDFSAVTGGTGTATANVLNDYEEGTWVPTQGAGLTVVGAFSSNGTYTKVGRLVTINGVVIGATSIAVAATSILCAGLPFSATNEATTTSVNGSFTASSFCAINAANLYAVTSMVASTSIRFTATYYV